MLEVFCNALTIDLIEFRDTLFFFNLLVFFVMHYYLHYYLHCCLLRSLSLSFLFLFGILSPWYIFSFSLSPSLKSVLYMEKHRLSPLSDCSCCFLLFFSFFFYYVVLEWCTLSQMVRLYSGQVVVVVSSLVVGWLVVCDEMIHMVKKRQCCTSQRQFAKKSRW